MENSITKKTIEEMTYTQFVAYIDQWNVPPGALDTINQWSVFGHVQSDSNVLEVACTTGLSSREIARITGCRAKGIDICSDSIKSAQYNSLRYGKGLQLEYECIDACEFEPQEKYTHMIIGAALGFFKNQNLFLSKMPNFFAESGYILASPYYGKGTMPESLKAECRRVIGITPTTMSYDDVRNIYADFEVAYEKRNEIVLETEKQIEKYTLDSVKRACEIRKVESEEVFDAMYKRLYEIKKVSNELHAYQAYSVLVLRYLEDVYPNKFLELF